MRDDWTHRSVMHLPSVETFRVASRDSFSSEGFHVVVEVFDMQEAPLYSAGRCTRFVE